jgi:hypothetical protein
VAFEIVKLGAEFFAGTAGSAADRNAGTEIVMLKMIDIIRIAVLSKLHNT